MKQRFTKLLLLFAVPISFSLSGLAQPTRLTNMSYGAFSAFGGMHPQGNSLYFVGRWAADTYEWSKLDLGNSNVNTNTTQLTNDHYRVTGATIIAAVTRIGSNIFSCYAKPSTVQDLEFSRFNTETVSEQWADINVGTSAYSYPTNFTLDPSTGRVYFSANAGTGFQVRYWNPTSNSITQVSNIPNGISQPSSGNFCIVGDTVYTTALIGSYYGFIKIHKVNGGYVFYDLNGMSSPRNYTFVNNKLFFAARTGIAGVAPIGNEPYNIYTYSPTNGAFTKLTDFTQTQADGNLSSFALTPDRSTMFVNVNYYDPVGGNPVQGRFISINTSNGAVADRSGPSLTERNVYLYCSNTNVYVTRFNGTTRTLYKIDLASNNSTALTGNQFTAIGAATDGFNGSIYLSATEPTFGSEVYSFTPATDAFTRLTDINTSGNSVPASFLAYGSTLYFTATTSTTTADYEIYSLPIAMVLPLQILSFNAVRANNEAVQLSWKVAEQHSIKRFFVEKSTDGIAWSTVTTIPATGGTTYQYLDKSKAETVVYYRIKEESADGTVAYSDTKKILNAVRGKSFMLAANPAINKTITVQFSAAAKAGTVIINNEAGAVVTSKKWTGGIGTLQIPVAASGMYMVSYQSETEKVIVN